ncbi:slx8p [Saccharomyces arboricola H-6]|uniref:Slx8p n=1 Tax=Saccharomyces arboricola (strain H-6 / AS 2.3317 / CBS 10644) TaxID=1160507 RepID=J8Q8S5_SACAR|nr:slx8p [Saccharomyces arboricola H-6]
MIRRPENQSSEDENLRIKRARIDAVEQNGEDESSVPTTQNLVTENNNNISGTAVEIVGERGLDNASEDDDLSLFRALEEGSGSDRSNVTAVVPSTNDRRPVGNDRLEVSTNDATTSRNYDQERRTIEVLSQTAGTPSASLTPGETPSLSKAGLKSNEQPDTLITEAIDLDAEEQQVLEISDEDFQEETKEPRKEYGAAKDYRCPICFDPPETALMTLCGHVFCCSCLFQMVNSSRTCRQFGHCALCRSKVYLKDVRLIILRKRQVKKKTKS